MNAVKAILRTPAVLGVIIAATVTAVIALIGVIITNENNKVIAALPINATMTAEAKLTEFANLVIQTQLANSLTTTYQASDIPTLTLSPIDLIPTELPSLTPQPTNTLLPTPIVLVTDLPAGTVDVSLSDGMKTLYVPAGEFIMGAENGDPDELPIHKVYLDSYWIDQTEVTNAMYKMCVDVGTCPTPINEEYFGKSQYADYPVVYVTWNNAKSYCEWAGRRLPTEAEWEKAARGTDGRIYPWGDGTNCRKANYESCFGSMRIVGFYNPGPYGTLDMVGNAWEWVLDWYDEFYYEKSPHDNPQGPSTGQYRGLRSGSWETKSKDARTPARSYSSADDSKPKISFRCARTP